MPRDPRHFVPRSLVEVTTRTIQGRLLMRPSRAFNEIFLGTLGYAQAKHDLEIHAFATLSNHYHLHCSPEDPEQLADFMRLFNSKLAKEIGRLHDWHDNVWSRRFCPIPISEEPAAQIARLKYLLSHGVKEGLVETPRAWPGPNCVDALVLGAPLHGVWFNRSLEYEADRQGVEFGIYDFASLETVKLSPYPCWRHLTSNEHRLRVRELVEQIEESARVDRRSTERPVLGAAFVLRQDPHERPMRCKRSPAPRFHAASKAVRRAMREAFRRFLAAYRRASESFRAGVIDVEFPAFCFPPPRPFTRGSPALTG